MHLSIEDLANWLANPEIKNNPTIINKKVSKTDIEWFDLMEESSSKRQKKTKVSQPIEEDSEAGPGPTTQAYKKGKRKDQRKETSAFENIDQKDDSEGNLRDLDKKDDSEDDSEDDPRDLDKKVPWPVPFPDKKCHWKVWQKGIQTAKNMFKVDGAEYTFSTWFAVVPGEEITNILLLARSEKEVAKKVKEAYLHRGWHTDNETMEEWLQENIESLIREYKVENKGSPEWIAHLEHSFEKDEIRHNYTFKIIDKYQPIRESKRTDKKFVPEGPNVILTKKTKPGFWVGIDEKFLVRIIQGEKVSEYRELDANAVVYGLYRIQEPDSKQLMPMKDGALNCVAQRVIEHFKKAKRGYRLTNIRKQKIGTWEKRMRQPGA
ncbi:hypothetical protein RhiirC2_721548 [Rhizophagus irregularis]|uniref:Uncharacterized protein n=1 Tax=Rhizophagus irregularis TaxID=588596 RepID=A0A2N1M5L2_9GLOM|nr:hypothetical protein RhiirC2_721548 [Rhizophagus irregularis]